MLGTWFLRGFGKRSEDATGDNDEPFLAVAYSWLWLDSERKIVDPREGKDPYSYPGVV
jgi:hypothetical protein